MYRGKSMSAYSLQKGCMGQARRLSVDWHRSAKATREDMPAASSLERAMSRRQASR